jgi:hypothetical protein
MIIPTVRPVKENHAGSGGRRALPSTVS